MDIEQTLGKILAILEVLQSDRTLNEQRFSRIEERFALIDQRFEQMERRFEQIDQRFEKIEAYLKTDREIANARFGQTSSAIHELRLRIDQVETRLGAKIEDLRQTFTEDPLAVVSDAEKLQRRVKALERKSA